MTSRELFKKIIESDEHGHAIVEADDREFFEQAGWKFAGTLSKDLKIYLRFVPPITNN